MTIWEAKKLLSGGLRFGDEQQLTALETLHTVEEARKRVMRCEYCLGEGVNKQGYPCAWCAAIYDMDILRSIGVLAYPFPP